MRGRAWRVIRRVANRSLPVLRARVLAGREPASRMFGLDRGTPVDRHYIEAFLERHHRDVQGEVLEFDTAAYTRRFGAGRVAHSHVMHSTPGNPQATIVADLTQPDTVPANAYDCIILTQTLQMIFNVQQAVSTCHAALVPGGVLLLSVPCISQVSRHDMDRWGDVWRFTPLAVRKLLEPAFGGQAVEVAGHGNALAACAFIKGLCAEELTRAELLAQDDDYPVVVTARATKARSHGAH